MGQKGRCLGEDRFGPSAVTEGPLCWHLSVTSRVSANVHEVSLVGDLCPPVAVSQGPTE